VPRERCWEGEPLGPDHGATERSVTPSAELSSPVNLNRFAPGSVFGTSLVM
jgi:hypothetical protein